MGNTEILNKVREILGMKVKLEQRKLDDNVTIIEAEVFEAGAEVVVITEDEQRIALPIGEYIMEDGMMLVVAEEGIIAEIKAAAEEEAVAEEEVPVVEEEVEAKTAPVKKSIESIVKETYFEEIEALTKENIELKSQLKTLDPLPKETLSEEDLKPAAKPIAHNPENTSARDTILFSQSRSETTMDRVLKKLNK